MDYLLSDISIVISKSGLYGFINQVGDNVTSSIVHSFVANKMEVNYLSCRLKSGRYAKLNRRLQGVNGEFRTEAGNYRSALSVVKGTFQSKYFQGQDGVQGPYRLTGENGEQFVIVLAGTERVFVNGVEVKRGEENEYIIDYGLGEVYFTNNLLIS